MIGPPAVAAELILLERIARYAGQIILPPICVKNSVLQNFEGHSMNLVRAGLQADFHHSARGTAIFGARTVRDDLHIADRFDRRPNDI